MLGSVDPMSYLYWASFPVSEPVPIFQNLSYLQLGLR